MAVPKVLFPSKKSANSTSNSNKNTTNKKHRKKTQRQIPPSAHGEEFGLVPARYLKRRTVDDDSSNYTPSATTPSTPYTGGGTPPRKPYKEFSAAISPSPSLPQTPQHHILKDADTNRNNNNALDPALKTDEERLQLKLELNYSLRQRGMNLLQSEFVEDWKAACLRAEGYDISKATLRILHHWRAKSELFGTPDLKVTINDVAPNLVHSGMIQLVPVRDLAGRAVVCMKFDPQVYATQEREVRTSTAMNILDE
jgi:hypothetical protein